MAKSNPLTTPSERNDVVAQGSARRAPLPFAAGRSSTGAGWAIRDEAIMGTAIRVELWADEPALAEAAMQAVIDEMHRIDRAMSPHKADSELSHINRVAASQPALLSDEMFVLLGRAIEFSELSGGAFDITYAAVGHLYDYRLKQRPTEEALERARLNVGWKLLDLDQEARTLRFRRDGMRIDLGGFAKGHAVDNAIRILGEMGIQHAMVSAGGDSRILGDRRGRPWTVAVSDPRRAGEYVAVLPLEDVSISTSGDYERFFEQNGERFHHLIDPATGRSPTGVHSVTILAENGLTTEALSKSVFVLGVDAGMKLVESQPGVDAIVVDAAGALHFSAGLMNAASEQAA